MDRHTALRKVLRCLRLAASSNPHEAAAALRQARAMMDEHGLTEADVVANGFRCEVIIMRTRAFFGVGSTSVRFFGAGSDAEIAAYAFTVLRRQLEGDKAKHTARIRKRANKERRGEEFSCGWISAIRHQFSAADLPADRKAAIDHAVKSQHTNLSTISGREIGKSGRASQADYHTGYIKGSNARLNPGISENGPRKLEHSA